MFEADAEQEAARWFAASRRGVMPHDERAEFESWKRAPANAARLAEMQTIWQELDPAGGARYWWSR
jgi:transmembrane sensor